MPSRLLLCFSLTVSLAGAAAAQAPAYETAEGTSLTYREVTRGTHELVAPQGPIPIGSFHDATISVTFISGGAARAVYDALEVAVDTPEGRAAPDTAPVLGQPFTLRFEPGGRVVTTATPAFPASFEGISDLRWQFFDFFLPLPSEPLSHGLVWGDTLRADDGEFTMTKRGRYEMAGDTLIAGVPAKVIASVIENRVESAGPGPSPGISLVTVLDGVERGEFYFSPERGVLVGRRRSGDLRGEMRYEGGEEQPVVFPQRWRYESTIELL